MLSREEYFKLALRNKTYVSVRWIMICFGIIIEDNDKVSYPADIIIKDGKCFCWHSQDDIEEIDFDIASGSPMFPVKEAIEIGPEDMSNVSSKLKTNYGTAIANAIMFEWAFGNIVPFMNERVNGKKIDKVIEKLMRSESITVKQYFDHRKAMDHITVFNNILLVSATPRGLLASEAAIKVKNELVEKYKDQLDDPIIGAKIDRAIYEADMNALKDDPISGYYINKKSYETIRKKLYHAEGGVTRLDDPTKIDYVTTSLAEGAQPKDWGAKINASRSGSYDRGAGTAMGGEASEIANRVYQSTKLAEDNCNSVVGLPLVVREEDVSNLTGRYIVGSEKPFSNGDAAKYIGKEIIIRDPIGCNTANGNYCKRCVGDFVGSVDIAIGPQMAATQSVFLKVFLAAFHQAALTTELYDYEYALS